MNKLINIFSQTISWDYVYPYLLFLVFEKGFLFFLESSEGKGCWGAGDEGLLGSSSSSLFSAASGPFSVTRDSNSSSVDCLTNEFYIFKLMMMWESSRYLWYYLPQLECWVLQDFVSSPSTYAFPFVVCL